MHEHANKYGPVVRGRKAYSNHARRVIRSLLYYGYITVMSAAECPATGWQYALDGLHTSAADPRRGVLHCSDTWRGERTTCKEIRRNDAIKSTLITTQDCYRPQVWKSNVFRLTYLKTVSSGLEVLRRCAI